MLTLTGYRWRMSHADRMFHLIAAEPPTAGPITAACGYATVAEAVDPVASTGDVPPLCPMCLVRAGTVEAERLEDRHAKNTTGWAAEVAAMNTDGPHTTT